MAVIRLASFENVDLSEHFCEVVGIIEWIGAYVPRIWKDDGNMKFDPPHLRYEGSSSSHGISVKSMILASIQPLENMYRTHTRHEDQLHFLQLKGCCTKIDAYRSNTFQ